jgi:DNA-binding response OmpR family regulator
MHRPASTILVIEDDAATRSFLMENLGADGYAVLGAETVEDGLRMLETALPALALVDIGLPGTDGYELLRMVRQSDGVASRLDPQIPMIVVSGRGDDVARVRAFERGADDVVVKPFCYPELRARVAAVLRRCATREVRGRMLVGPLDIDPATRQVLLRGERVALPAKEFALLRALATSPTRVFTKDELLRAIWGFKTAAATRTLDTHACRLRTRLRIHGDRLLITVWGVGYRLVDGPGPGELT